MAETMEIEVVEGPEEVDGYAVDPEEGDQDQEDVLSYRDDSENLVPDFMRSRQGRLELKRIAEDVRRDFDNAWDSSEEYRERVASDWQIFEGKLPKKTFPFEDCANVQVPIMLENLTRLTYRAAGELFGDWQSVFGVVPVGPDDEEVSELLSRHGNWQISEKIPDFDRQQHRGLLMFFTHGDVCCHSYFDPSMFCNRHDMLTTDEFVMPYVYTSTMPDYSDLPYYVKVLMYNKHELERYAGVWHGVRDVIDGTPPSWDDDPETLLRDAAAEVEGIVAPTSGDGSAPYKILQYEGWMDLPNQDRQRFVQAILDFATGTLLSLTIHEETSWEDLERFNRQKAELQQFRQQKEQFRSANSMYMQARNNIEANPHLTPEDRIQVEGYLRSNPPPVPPEPPTWMKEPEDLEEQPKPPRKVPIRMFAHGVCIEPLAGNLGFGFGRIQADFNRAANTALNQFTDAASLNNVKSFITTDIEFENPFTIKPGAINRVTGVSGGDLKNNIMPLNIGPASPQLMDVVDKMYSYGQSSIQSPNVLSGEPGKSGETFRGIAARIEQATKQLSVATQKYSRFLTTVLRNNGKLNAHFMPEEEFFSVNDHRLGGQVLKIGRQAYRRSYRVRIRADLKFATDASKVADADQLVQSGMQIPQLQTNNAFMYSVIKKSLEARDRHDLVDKLGAEPPPPPEFGAPPPPPPGTAPPGPGGPPPGPMPPRGPQGPQQ